MNKYKKYYGIIIFAVIIVVAGLVAYQIISPQITKHATLLDNISTKSSELENLTTRINNVKAREQKLKQSVSNAQKKIYTPLESDLSSDSLFFTLYDDIIEMAHVNSVQIKSLNYEYNPESDEFVKNGKDMYFVCDMNMELVSNYTNLGKLIQDFYQYPYYIRLNTIETKPYAKDKKTLFTNLSIRLYAHTEPDTVSNMQ